MCVCTGSATCVVINFFNSRSLVYCFDGAFGLVYSSEVWRFLDRLALLTFPAPARLSATHCCVCLFLSICIIGSTGLGLCRVGWSSSSGWLLICWSESSWNCVSVGVRAGGACWLSIGVTIDVPAPDRFARRICCGSTVFPEGGSMECAVAGL